MLIVIDRCVVVASNEGSGVHNLHRAAGPLTWSLSFAMWSSVSCRLSCAMAQSEHDVSSVSTEGHQSQYHSQALFLTARRRWLCPWWAEHRSGTVSCVLEARGDTKQTLSSRSRSGKIVGRKVSSWRQSQWAYWVLQVACLSLFLIFTWFLEPSVFNGIR